MKQYWVTGGCGFIGVNLLTQLVARGDRVRVLDNLSLGKREDIERFNVELQVGDIRDVAAVAKACQGVDVVVHLAAHTRVIESVENPRLNFEINAVGTLNVLEACRAASVKKMIFASTGGAILGEQIPPVNEGMVPRPVSASDHTVCRGKPSDRWAIRALSLARLRVASLNPAARPSLKMSLRAASPPASVR